MKYEKSEKTNSALKHTYRESSEVAYTTDLNINETYMPKEYYEHLHWIYDILIKIFKNKNTITLIYDDLDSIDTDVKFDSFHVELLNGLIAVK